VGSVLARRTQRGARRLFAFVVPAADDCCRAALPKTTCRLYAPSTPFDAGQYETRALFFPSKDGTRIPLFVTMRKGATLDGTRPALLYGYGGFNVAVKPTFSPSAAAWLELGGIYAVASLRGGSEYGEEWHRAGTRERKQNVFDDFIGAAEYLVKEKYTTPSRLVMRRFQWRLLVAAAMIQRPELFASRCRRWASRHDALPKFTAGPSGLTTTAGGHRRWRLLVTRRSIPEPGTVPPLLCGDRRRPCLPIRSSSLPAGRSGLLEAD
jgi:hypothetical protein